MTSPKRKRNIIGYDAAARAFADMNQDVADLMKLFSAPPVDTFSQADKILDQIRLDHIKMRKAFLPPIMDPYTPLKDIFAASNHIYDVLGKSSESMDIGDMVHESWREQVGSLTDLSAQLDAAAKLSLGENLLPLAATETILSGIDLDFLEKKFDFPPPTIAAVEKSLFDTTASYRALMESIQDLSGLVQMPSFVLPGATYNLYTAGHALKALDLVDEELDEDEEIEEELAFVSAKYVDNLDIVGLLESVDRELLPMYLGAQDDVNANRPDRARHVLVSLRELTTHLLNTLAPKPDVKVWLCKHGTPDDFDKQGGPKRKAKIRYILRFVSHKPLAKFVQCDADAFEELYQLYNKLHGKKPNLTDLQLLTIFRKTEATLTFLIKTWASSAE